VARVAVELAETAPHDNREKISGVDTAWLRMEQPTNLMMIVGVMMFDGKVRARDVKRMLAARWLGFRRFRQKAVQDAPAPGGRTRRFDIDWPRSRVSAARQGRQEELEALVSELASTRSTSTAPLAVPRGAQLRGGTALVQRIHHCYADGIALIQVMLSLTHATAEGSLELPAEGDPARRRGPATSGSRSASP
jgi:hypothetical protein